MTDEPVPELTTEQTPLTALVLCQGVGCTRVAHWLITGENAGGEEVYCGHACDAALHQAKCKQLAWGQYNVTLVKLRRLDKVTT